MTVHTSLLAEGVTSSRNIPRVSIVETYWGFVIRPSDASAERAVLIERVAGIAGLSFMAIASGYWLFPEQYAKAISGHVIAPAITMAMAGLLFLWICFRGLTHEMQVDRVRRCVRMLVRNRNRRTRVLRVVPYDDIGSAFVRRGEKAQTPATLFLRLNNGQVVKVAAGREVTLNVLHRRLSNELGRVPVTIRGWERHGRKLVPIVKPAPEEIQVPDLPETLVSA